MRRCAVLGDTSPVRWPIRQTEDVGMWTVARCEQSKCEVIMYRSRLYGCKGGCSSVNSETEKPQNSQQRDTTSFVLLPTNRLRTEPRLSATNESHGAEACQENLDVHKLVSECDRDLSIDLGWCPIA